jgi:hypothetical protein
VVGKVLLPFVELVVLGGGRLFWVVAGVLRFVDRFTISLPCTTRLSVDFFKSLVSISRFTVSLFVVS